MLPNESPIKINVNLPNQVMLPQMTQFSAVNGSGLTRESEESKIAQQVVQIGDSVNLGSSSNSPLVVQD